MYNHLNKGNEIWTNCSTLDVGVLAYAVQLHSKQKQLTLKLETQPKQLYGSLLIRFQSPCYHLVDELSFDDILWLTREF